MTTHGYTKNRIRTPEYRAWASMRERCLRTTHKQFNHYGGRGITICERWDAFENFLADMGERPSPKHTLERLNNEQGYNPENCAWKTMHDQSRNRRNSRKITYNNTTANLSDWADMLGMSVQTLRYRLNHWPVDKVMKTPVHDYVFK